MMPATQPLRDEHSALLPELGALRVAADAVGTREGPETLDRACRLLDRHLLPHMKAEETTLYPTIDRILGTDATVTMRHDHEEIRRRIADLYAIRGSGVSDANTDRDLRAALYGLAAIVRLHLSKEEELYYPILDERLRGAEGVEVVNALHAAERDLYRRDATSAE